MLSPLARIRLKAFRLYGRLSNDPLIMTVITAATVTIINRNMEGKQLLYTACIHSCFCSEACIIQLPINDVTKATLMQKQNDTYLP
jgi:L-lactate utilization protein LutB